MDIKPNEFQFTMQYGEGQIVPPLLQQLSKALALRYKQAVLELPTEFDL